MPHEPRARAAAERDADAETEAERGADAGREAEAGRDAEREAERDADAAAGVGLRPLAEMGLPQLGAGLAAKPPLALAGDGRPRREELEEGGADAAPSSPPPR